MNNVPFKEKTQIEIIEEHLLTQDTITPPEAVALYNVWRLAAVIHKLRKLGYCIIDKNENNPKQKQAEYYIDGGDRYGIARIDDNYMLGSVQLQTQYFTWTPNKEKAMPLRNKLSPIRKYLLDVLKIKTRVFRVVDGYTSP